MIWNKINYCGFLPSKDPLQVLPVGDYYFVLEFLGKNLPLYLEQRKWREEVVSVLRSYHPFYPNVTDKDYYAINERMMLLYSYFASAYVYANYETPAARLPKEIAQPLMHLSLTLKRPPILSYASYCLYNWRRKSIGEVEVDNIELLQNFSLNNKTDEDWFILIHVDIEYKARIAVQALYQVLNNYAPILPALSTIFDALQAMNSTLKRMPEHCHPENYFNKVRPYIFGFNGVDYEPAFGGKSLRGETGAQSSIIPSLLAFFGIKHKRTILTDHLEDMRNYMPYDHREFIKGIETAEFSLRDSCKESPELKDLYNLCLEEIIEFRKTHFNYAIDYIQAKVSNPKGTGGTPYIEWLGELIKETEEFILR